MNKTLDKYCKYLYFWNGKPTTLGQLSNVQLESIIKFIEKYPQGLLNGYSKVTYYEAVKYILQCRLNAKDNIVKHLEAKHANNAEIKAEKLTEAIINSMVKTEKQYDGIKRCIS